MQSPVRAQLDVLSPNSLLSWISFPRNCDIDSLQIRGPLGYPALIPSIEKSMRCRQYFVFDEFFEAARLADGHGSSSVLALSTTDHQPSTGARTTLLPTLTTASATAKPALMLRLSSQRYDDCSQACISWIEAHRHLSAHERRRKCEGELRGSSR